MHVQQTTKWKNNKTITLTHPKPPKTSSPTRIWPVRQHTVEQKISTTTSLTANQIRVFPGISFLDQSRSFISGYKKILIGSVILRFGAVTRSDTSDWLIQLIFWKWKIQRCSEVVVTAGMITDGYSERPMLLNLATPIFFIPGDKIVVRGIIIIYKLY